jgi:hypothetical protein
LLFVCLTVRPRPSPTHTRTLTHSLNHSHTLTWLRPAAGVALVKEFEDSLARCTALYTDDQLARLAPHLVSRVCAWQRGQERGQHRGGRPASAGCCSSSSCLELRLTGCRPTCRPACLTVLQVSFVKRGEAASAGVPEGQAVPGFSPAEAAPVAADFSQRWQHTVETINRRVGGLGWVGWNG